MDSLWSRQSLVEYIDQYNRTLLEDLSPNDFGMLKKWLLEQTSFAMNEVLIGKAKIEDWKLPVTADRKNPITYAACASVVYSTTYGVYPTPSQVNYLACADVGNYQPAFLTNYVYPDADYSKVPQVLSVNVEATELAIAFYKQMLKRTEDKHPTPLLGEFRMTKTGLDLIDNLGLKEIRFVIANQGFWISSILPDGRYVPAWWSPKGDSFSGMYGHRFAWAFRTFAACLWHDLHDTKVTAWKVTKDRERRQMPKREKDEVVIVLPRTVKNLSWEDGIRHSWENSEKKDYSVRAHYRRLHETWWQPSGDAIQLALEHGFPEPPEGYTFVRPYDVGDGGLNAPPRLVAKGLQAAKVALAKL